MITNTQKSIITGSLLGDGYLSNIKKSTWNSNFSKSQKRSKYSYVKWHFEQLKPFSNRVFFGNATAKGKKYKCVRFDTSCNRIFTKLRKQWYPNDVKSVPKNIKLDPLAIAIWFCDDGYNDIKSRVCSFATCAFSKDDCLLLIEKLREFGIVAKLRNGDKDNKRRIHVPARYVKNLIDLIKPFVKWKCFKHKIQYRDRLLKRLTDEETMGIYAMRSEGVKLKEIAKAYGVCETCVSAICNKKTKAHLWK